MLDLSYGPKKTPPFWLLCYQSLVDSEFRNIFHLSVCTGPLRRMCYGHTCVCVCVCLFVYVGGGGGG